MNKETRNHYLKLLGVFAVMFLIGTIYNEIFNKSESPIKVKEEDVVDGGECDYQNEDFPALILEIDSSNVNYCNLKLLRLPERIDTLIYTEINGNDLRVDSLKVKNILVGDTIIYQIQTNVSGTCQPTIELIVVEKFKK